MSLIRTALLLMLCWSGTEFRPAAVIPCKYSVRDVAFVNSHQQPWSLRLLKPESATAAQLEDWNATLRSGLEGTNIDFGWVDRGGLLQERLSGKMKQSNIDSEIGFFLDSPQGSQHGYWSSDKLQETIDQLVESPLRTSLLDDLSRRLCVFLLIESGDEQQDALAQQAVEQAVASVTQQMWSYEKTPEQGPSFYRLASSEREQEEWLLRSIDPLPVGREFEKPLVVVLYGQGVVLGEPIEADNQLQERLVARASICGRDCECDLDKEWLYGRQILHRWTLDHERAAETSLDFDPHSSLVQAEVTQILQKSNPQGGAVGIEPAVTLGGGLIIHDLDELEAPALSGKATVQTGTTADTDPPEGPGPLPGDITASDRPAEQPVPRIPWFLLGSLTLGLLVLIGIFWQRLKPGTG
ncbi:MAG: hypothetical protein VYE64_11435 [Planctomycetota bacterium]|nr:hypothetical protein [Planctomycetota bacterium]